MFPLTSYVNEPIVYPIDKGQKACTDKDSTTAGMTKCADAAYDMWNKELNKNYRRIDAATSATGQGSPEIT
jgi:uncharacterized protein YecT (DUF1311 family)